VCCICLHGLPVRGAAVAEMHARREKTAMEQEARCLVISSASLTRIHFTPDQV
jgi:hypothetical protein